MAKMTSTYLLLIVCVSMVIFGHRQAEGRRPSKRLNYYNYDDESDIFERQSDTEYQLQPKSHEDEDPMDEALDTSDLDIGLGSRFGRKKHRLQRKPARKFPETWSMLVHEGEKEMREDGHFDADFKMLDEEDEQH
ncbi:uncharacterized protein LOC108033173 [Drosophila biarmipes]|uniref:uncharacterized protein LOC108033173 n=1 Tax=Drosophila biarmipes TaxID=125945 RepID=UPI0007E7AD15|nr:uncharacterized protein LOC108033173 [Drosophila biarmipes]